MRRRLFYKQIDSNKPATLEIQSGYVGIAIHAQTYIYITGTEFIGQSGALKSQFNGDTYFDVKIADGVRFTVVILDEIAGKEAYTYILNSYYAIDDKGRTIDNAIKCYQSMDFEIIDASKIKKIVIIYDQVIPGIENPGIN